ENGLNFHYMKVTIAYCDTGYSLGVPGTGHYGTVALISGDVFEDIILAAPICDICGRDLTAITAIFRGTSPGKHNTIGFRKRQTSQQDRVNHAENGCVGADAQCERKDGHYGEARRLEQHSNCKAEILKKRFHRRLTFRGDGHSRR